MNRRIPNGTYGGVGGRSSNELHLPDPHSKAAPLQSKVKRFYPSLLPTHMMRGKTQTVPAET